MEHKQMLFTIACLFLTTIDSMPTTSVQHKISSEKDRSQTVYEGETIEISCNASGPTTAVFHWLHNGVFMEQGPLDFIASNIVAPAPTSHLDDWIDVTVEATLVLRNVNQRNSGKYTCVADSTKNRVAESFSVDVLPKNDYKSTEANSDVRIYQRNAYTWQFEGEDAHLLCRATQGFTKSAPPIRWTLDGAELTPLDKNYKIFPNGDLRITKLTPAHFGQTLECTAFGENGTVDSYKPFIYVYKRDEKK